MRLSYARLLLMGFAAAALLTGILAYHDPLRLNIDIGDSYDTPFVAGMAAPLPGGDTDYRWTNGQALVKVEDAPSNYPLTVSFESSPDYRPSYERSLPLTLTVTANGQQVFSQPLDKAGGWYSFTVAPSPSRELNLFFTTRAWLAQNGMTRLGMGLDEVTIGPAAEPAPFADLNWRAPLLLALICVLLCALGLAGGIWRAGLLGLLGLLGGGAMLWLERPLFALYAPAVAIGLGLLLLLLRFVRPKSRWLAWLLLGGALALYLFFLSGQIESDDDLIKYYITESLVTRHNIIFTPQYGPSGYSRYGLGHILVEAPFLALGKLGEFVRGAPLDRLRLFSVTLMNPVIGALLVALIYATGLLFYSRRVAMLLALIAAVATIIFPYALLTATEPILALLLLAALYSAVRYFAAPSTSPVSESERIESASSSSSTAPPAPSTQGKWLARAGLALGMLALTKPEYILFALLIVGWWLLRSWRTQGASLRSLAYQLVWLVGPMLVAMIEIITLNAARGLDAVGSADAPQVFALPDIGATLGGIYGALFSVGKSIFIYSPPLLLLPFALPAFIRKRAWDGWLWIGLVATALLFYGRLSFWAGDLAYGDRYMMPFTPLLLLPIGEIIPRLGRAGRWAVATLCGLGVAVQTLAALTDFASAFFFLNVPGATTNAQLYRMWEFEPKYSEITMQLQALGGEHFKEQAITQLSYFGLPGFADYLVPGLLFAVIIYAGIWLYRSLQGGAQKETDQPI